VDQQVVVSITALSGGGGMTLTYIVSNINTGSLQPLQQALVDMKNY